MMEILLRKARLGGKTGEAGSPKPGHRPVQPSGPETERLKIELPAHQN